MYQHARDLEFEQAAQVRDEIAYVRQEGLGLPEKTRAGEKITPTT
jgi:protein-arginine kinase activator protein McsA